MRTTVAERVGIALLVVAAGLTIGATSGISMNQVRTAAPGAVSVSGVAAAEGSSLAAARADHAHSLTGTLPIANGGTGNTSGLAATATALAANPTNCSIGQAAIGIAADGSAEGCFTPAGTYALPDATAAVTGGIRLTGDLGGTATSPTVPGLASRSGTGACGANTWASTLNGAAAPTCTQPAFSNLSGSASSAQLPAASTTLGAVKMASACGAGNHVSSIGAGGELTCTADAGGAGGSPGGSSGQIQYNGGGSFAGAARTGIDAAGNIVLPGGAEPAVPASGVTLFSEDRGDVSLLASIGVQGYDRYAQPHFGMENVAMMFPAGGATGTTAPSVIGMTVTHEGTTIANPAPASTNFYTATTRITSTSGTTVGNGSGWRAGQLRYWRGNAAGLGGYHCHFRWCNDTATASNRGFVGLSASVSARANQNPSADLNFVGAFWDSTSTSILLGGNDGSGTATATTTCSATDFPPRTAGHCFSLDLAAKKNAAQVSAYLKRLDTSGITPCTATISAAGDQPANTAFLAPRIHQQTSTTSATGVGVLKLYCEQDY